MTRPAIASAMPSCLMTLSLCAPLGAALGASGLKASIQSGEPWHQLIDRTFAERDDDELPQTRALLGNLGETAMLVDWRIALRTMLAGYAAARDKRESLARTVLMRERQA